MAWVTGKLSDVAIRTAKPAKGLRKLSDGKGLQFWITPKGGKYWRLEYRFQGKRKLLALGTYPEISVSAARDKAREARELLAKGSDPSEAKKQASAAAKLEHESVFKAIAEKLVTKKRRAGKATITISKMEWILGKVYPEFGSRPIANITVQDIVRCITKEDDAGNYETAKRMRTTIGEVFRFAMQSGIINHDPVPATRGILTKHKAKHFAAILKPRRLGELLRAIEGYNGGTGRTRAALHLMALLYPRPGELRQARWDEFDLQQAQWTIPAERMKMREAHVKVLPKQAVAILTELQKLPSPSGFVLPAEGRRGRPMSENTLNGALRRLGFTKEEHSSHGFRATASTMINASNRFSADAIERSLAHQDGDAVRGAYARGDAMAERKIMAQWWADHLDELRDNKPPAHNVLHMAAKSSR